MDYDKDIIKNAIKTDTLYVSVSDHIQIEKPVLPNFNDMTKPQLEEWALEHIGIEISMRIPKSDMIKTITNNL